VNYLSRWLKENHIDAIVSTGPPHSMHLIAMAVHEKTGIPWLADFRDPWVNIDFAGDLKMSSRARKLNMKLEKKVLDSCNQVVVVGDFMAEEFRSKTQTPVSVITNGYDPADFDVEIPAALQRSDDCFRIVHTGSLNDRRNHPAFWRALAELKSENEEFAHKLQIKLIGKNDASVRQSIMENGLLETTEFIDYLPHDQVIAHQKTASVLYLSINNYGNMTGGFFSPKATLTGKLFEYLAAQRPILMQGPGDSQAAQVIGEHAENRIIGFEDLNEIKSSIKDMFSKRTLSSSLSNSNNRYSRIKLTGEMAEVLSKISKINKSKTDKPVRKN
jgi:glycosyltransferase involved in cell wall biosynthesis